MAKDMATLILIINFLNFYACDFEFRKLQINLKLCFVTAVYYDWRVLPFINGQLQCFGQTQTKRKRGHQQVEENRCEWLNAIMSPWQAQLAG